jgi:hypothetical protein
MGLPTKEHRDIDRSVDLEHPVDDIICLVHHALIEGNANVCFLLTCWRGVVLVATTAKNSLADGEETNQEGSKILTLMCLIARACQIYAFHSLDIGIWFFLSLLAPAFVFRLRRVKIVVTVVVLCMYIERRLQNDFRFLVAIS